MKHLVIIGLVIPEPASTAAGSRMMQLIHMFENNGYKVTFLTAATNVEFSEKIKVEKINLNDDRFDHYIKSLQPDVVLFDRYISEEQFGWRVTENCPNALKILDTEDLHFLREARRLSYSQDRKLEYVDLLNPIFKREIASILRCDLSLIISQYEHQLLIDTFRIHPSLLHYIPFLTENISEESTDFEDRKDFVSIGNFLHEPNWQTVLQLKKRWKTLRKRIPDAQLHIYGAYATEKAFQLHNEQEGFFVKGRADSVENLFKNYRVLLAPIPFGAGLKGKLWESMKFGLPNITTSVGAEGLNGNLAWNGFVEDDEEQFIEKAVQLYQDQKIWKKAQENGFNIIKKRFMKIGFEERMFSLIETLSSNIDRHRNENYLGQVLQHHQLNSTKYLSKWIAEKNKK